LVEVTIALGLVTFAMVSTLAILPVGLSSLRDAREIQAQANILQQVGTDFEATPFAEIPATNVFHFDPDGLRLADSDTAGPGSYEVTTQVSAPSYPGMPGSIANRLKRVEIEILRLDRGEGQPSARTPVRAALEVADSGQ